jgi:hypothetical protein
MKKVPAREVVTTPEAPESPLPPQIQETLGELVGAAKEGLLALSVGVGLVPALTRGRTLRRPVEASPASRPSAPAPGGTGPRPG